MNDDEVGTTGTEVSRKVTRRDVADNRRRLLAAARRLLGRGRPVSARDLARAADVSVATLYRHFPARTGLVAAVHAEQAGVCQASVERAVADPDPARAIRTYLRDTFAVQAADPRFTAAYRTAMAAAPDSAARRARFRREMGALVARARAAGVVRPDLTPADLLLALAANGGVTATRHPDRALRSRRLAELTLTGLGLPPE